MPVSGNASPALNSPVGITSRPARSSRLLGQASPGVAAYDPIYTVASGLIGHVTSVVICNVGAATTYRVHHADGGGAAAAGNALWFDQAIPAAGVGVENTHVRTPGNEDGWAFSAGGILYAGSASGDCTISAYGYEETVT